MADLPEARVTPGKAPFSNGGLDCIGPLSVKRGQESGEEIWLFVYLQDDVAKSRDPML